MGVEKPYFNGAEEKSVSKVYKFAGSKFTYRREGHKEALSALGPIKDRIAVKVKISEEAAPINLRYAFYKPDNNGSQYYWSHFKWTDCSRTCGEGIQTRLFKCRKHEDDSEVTESNCFSSNKPEPLTKPCNLTACERFEWRVSKWTSCSLPCNGGNQTRKFECRAVLADHQANSSFCTGDKPETMQICNDEPCPAKWIVGNWSECSNTCGNSIQTRSVQCRDILGRVSLSCPRDTKALTHKVCRKQRCEGSVLANLSCSFEEGFCEWKNVRGSRLEQFDWTLLNGSTPSRNTGPTNDHTLGTSKGVYAYIEASDPQKRNDRARLISPVVRARRVCLDFWYHMYGQHMGWLRVFYRNPVSGRERRLWYKSRNQQNEWHNEQLAISSALPYQIVFEAIRGRGFSSDVALDDIKISSGGCLLKQRKTPQNQCSGDRSNYCKAAIRLNWCSSRTWGKICCETCKRDIVNTRALLSGS